MSVQSIVDNDLIEDAFSVWRLKNHSEFNYSDGVHSEKYLGSVFRKVRDLSTHSAELESFIKDWSSEYHLSTKRAQLLSGFTFDRSLKVLEVGCGCGAITRHLGENFNQVVSVEGNINRARLARERTRDLESISVVCAPFQELKFSQKFDIIFCIGVYEYSASFIEGDDPYDAALQYFSNMLNPDGIVVIAIENQFGLKYFSCAREDHLGVMFEGLEGYHRRPRKVRTFGKMELETKLKKYFQQVQFYYPYPDYKIPDCVISSQFFATVNAGELVSQMRSRDYSGPMRMLWDESAATLELSRNTMLEFFSNSFLVLASRSVMKGAAFEQLAVMFSSGRKTKFSTRTRILKRNDEQTWVEKRITQGNDTVHEGSIKMVETDSLWIDALSIQTQVILRARVRQSPLIEIFEPCKRWIEFLITESSTQNGVRYLEGAHIDSIWSNTFLVASKCRIIDREWIWEDKVLMNVVVIRAIYDFLSRIETTTSYAKSLSARSGTAMIQNIAATLGVDLAPEDFAEFIHIESEFQWIVSGVKRSRQSFYLRWFLADRPTRKFSRRMNRRVKELLSRIHERVSNLF